jgi:hypothetical protein
LRCHKWAIKDLQESNAEKRSYVGFEELDADVHTFDHIEKVRLEDERLPGVIEQTRRML